MLVQHDCRVASGQVLSVRVCVWGGHVDEWERKKKQYDGSCNLFKMSFEILLLIQS